MNMKRTGCILKRMLLCLIAAGTVWLCTGFRNASASEEGFTGTGTQKDPYLISSYEDLMLLHDHVDGGNTYADACFAQTADIAIPAGVNWDPIGDLDQGLSFSGIYDGQGYVISDIYCENVNAALFAWLNGEVCNLGIESGEFSGSCIGSIASHGTSDAKIINCYNKATVIPSYRGGGITDNFAGQILFCWNFGEITPTYDGAVTAGITSYGTARIQHTYTLYGAPVHPDTFSGTLFSSEQVSIEQIAETLENSQRQMLEWTEDREFTLENTVFMAPTEDSAAFMPGYIPTVYQEAIAEKEARIAKQLSTINNKYSFTGTGTEEDPFLIETYEDLAHMRDCVDLGVSYIGFHFAQTSDIEFPDGENWEPIGDVGNNLAFCGTYDGRGHVLKNVYCDHIHASIFAWLKGTVCNLGIESGEFSGRFIGSFASHGAGSARIFNCYNKASLSAAMRAGGIADNLNSGTIEYCWNLGSVKSESGTAGGIVSYSAKSLANCFAVGDKLITGSFSGEITDCRRIDAEAIDDTLLEEYVQSIALAADAEELSVFYLKLDEGELVFGDQSYVPAVIASMQRDSVLIENGTVVLLALASFVYAIYALVRLKKTGASAGTAAKASSINKAVKPDAQPGAEPSNKKSLIAGVALTLALSVIGLSIANFTLLLKREDGVITMQDYHRQPDDTIDVLILGSSRAGINLDAEVFWNTNGISTYALWGSVQPFWNSYYFLEEALTCSTPEVVVLEVRGATYDFEYSDEGRQYANVFGLELSPRKFDSAIVSAPQDRLIELVFGFPIYHTRYSELSKKDFSRYPWDASFGEESKGTSVRYGTTTVSGYSAAEDPELVKVMMNKSEVYLRRIIELCRSANIQLVLIANPTIDRSACQPYFNHVQQIADEYELPFINYNLLDDETGFGSTDFWTDDVHVNTNGARKISEHLSAYLAGNFELTDHRGDERYQSWEDFAHNTVNSYYEMITGQDDYIKELARNDRTVVFVKCGDVDADDVEELQDKMRDAGLNADFLNDCDARCWVMESTFDAGSTVGYELADCSFLLGTKEFTVHSDHITNISYDGEQIETLNSGVMCFVYDSYTQELVDSYKLN